LSSIIKGAHILLINDNPEEMRYVTEILEGLQTLVDVVRTTDEALVNMHSSVYDVVISDMRRDHVKDEGQRFLDETVRQGIERPTIFTVGQLECDSGVPPHAFGITNRVDELLHLVFDALERVRG
jgi:DNA-binding NtrC family response regulator